MALEKLGVTSWFDEEQMRGNIYQAMQNGIENSTAVVIFITENYAKKVNSGLRTDNCFFEFDYIFNRQKHFIAVVLK